MSAYLMQKSQNVMDDYNFSLKYINALK